MLHIYVSSLIYVYFEFDLNQLSLQIFEEWISIKSEMFPKFSELRSNFAKAINRYISKLLNILHVSVLIGLISGINVISVQYLITSSALKDSIHGLLSNLTLYIYIYTDTQHTHAYESISMCMYMSMSVYYFNFNKHFLS